MPPGGLLREATLGRSTVANMPNLLRLPNVLAIGSSRVAPRAENVRGDWAAIATNTHTSLETARAVPRG
jgi:hypothetical protein